MSLQGADALRRRLRALATVPKASGSSSLARRWQEATTQEAKRRVPVRTGATRNSIRSGATRRGNPTVVGKYTVNFIDAGSKAHVEPRTRGRRRTGKVLKFNEGGMTLFRKKVNKPRIAARPFKKESARRGLERVDFRSFIYGLWNRAA